MIGLLAAAAFALAPDCTGGLCGANALEPYFAKLARAKGREGRPVHVLQIGDSHSAGDAITSAWRDVLQARYGSGGRGVLPPGRPYEGYITHGITAAMSGGWSVAADYGKGSGDPKPPLGLSAFSLTSSQPGATMSLEAEPQQRFTRAVVCALARPGAGVLTIHAGEAIAHVALGSPSERLECTTVGTAPATHLDLVTDGGPVTITSWATFADQGGIAVSNLGVVGSQLVHFGRTTDTVLAEELRAYQPDLIVLEFGTNEGFAGRFSPFEYEIILRSQIARVRRLAGNVPILLMGAPDALASINRRDSVRDNAGTGPAPLCGDPAGAAPPPPTPAPVTSFGTAMAKVGDFLGVTSTEENVGKPPVPVATLQPAPQPTGARSTLYPPPALDAVRVVQRRVARSLHVAYWDWAARMGGRCTALGWARATPPLMRGDYVHYTLAGGREIAQRLQADLDAAAGR